MIYEAFIMKITFILFFVCFVSTSCRSFEPHKCPPFHLMNNKCVLSVFSFPGQWFGFFQASVLVISLDLLHFKTVK